MFEPHSNFEVLGIPSFVFNTKLFIEGRRHWSAPKSVADYPRRAIWCKSLLLSKDTRARLADQLIISLSEKKMSRFLLSRFVALNRVARLPVVLPPFRQVNVARFLASWGPDKEPADRKEIELRVIKAVTSHDKVDQSQVFSI